MTIIIDDLAREHARFRRYLGWYRREIEKLSRGNEPDYTLLDMLAHYFSQFPDELHHKKEDIIYGYLENAAPKGQRPLIDLHAQHVELSTRARRFAEMVENVLIDQELPIERVVKEAEEYSNALIAHMESEESSLFEPARRLLTTDDWSTIHEEISEMYVTGINLEKTRQVLSLEHELDAYPKLFATS